MRLSGGGIGTRHIPGKGSSGSYDASRIKIYALNSLLDSALGKHDA